uniref:(northern house mosquito) hypothetical protein n=1 Tax=Culex pipiens TaxID=7175 RepID=A0A8D8HKJ5_CULPI
MDLRRGDGWKGGVGSGCGAVSVSLALILRRLRGQGCFSGVPSRVEENSGRREMSERDEMFMVLLTGWRFWEVDLGLPWAVILFSIESGFIFSLRAGLGTAKTLGLAGGLGLRAERGVRGTAWQMLDERIRMRRFSWWTWSSSRRARRFRLEVGRVLPSVASWKFRVIGGVLKILFRIPRSLFSSSSSSCLSSSWNLASMKGKLRRSEASSWQIVSDLTATFEISFSSNLSDSTLLTENDAKWWVTSGSMNVKISNILTASILPFSSNTSRKWHALSG